jgi:hypothetical protein
MTYEAKITLKFDSTWEHKIGSSFGKDILPEEHITMAVPAQDLNTNQLFTLFTNFARAIGHTEMSIMQGACSVAFNDMRSEEEMRKVAEEYDLKLVEDYRDEVCKLEAEVRDLKAKLSRLENPDNPNYTDNEMEAMSAEGYGAWNNLVPGTDAAYAFGCKCPILDNQEMPDNKRWVNGDCPLHGKVK